MLFSSVAAVGGKAAAFAGAIAVAIPGVVSALGFPEAGEEEVVVPAEFVEVAGAVTAGLLACGTLAGGFGAKNFTQSKITAIERSEATRMRISEESSFFFSGPLTDVPLSQ